MPITPLDEAQNRISDLPFSIKIKQSFALQNPLQNAYLSIRPYCSPLRSNLRFQILLP